MGDLSAPQSAQLTVGSGLSTSLMQILEATDIEPGSSPSYSVCKAIFVSHPLGAKMAETPIKLAQSQPRELSIPGAPEEQLLDAFQKAWKGLGKVGADMIIRNLVRTSRIYGIASLVVGTRGKDANQPLDMETLGNQDLYFNTLDPLNTAGSLVLNQDPNAPDYQKPQAVYTNGQTYHPTRTLVVMNEDPVYIEFTDSAFGFVGRSVYQRSLYPLKSYIQTMITDDVVTRKAALIVAKLKSPGSIVDNIARVFYAAKRQAVKEAGTGNVLSIGIDETVESVDLKNLRDAAEFARNNILKNIATGANMPAVLLNQETLTDGFGEGKEDAKMVAQYIDTLRDEMNPVYKYLDNIVMHLAWTPEFYASIQRQFPEWKDVEYQTAFVGWKNSFTAEWPNLLVEPDSKKSEVADVKFKSVTAVAEVLMPELSPVNKVRLIEWISKSVRGNTVLFDEPLDFDLEEQESYTPPEAQQDKEPREPKPFSYET